MAAKPFSKRILSVATWNIAKVATSALATPVLARLLGAEGYGQYAYYIALIFLTSPLANLGASALLIKYIAERPSDLSWRHRLVALAGLINLLGTLSVAFLLMALLSGPSISAYSTLLPAVVVGALIFEQVWFFSRGILYGLHREELAALPAVIGVVVAAGLGVVLTLSGQGVTGVLVGLCLGNLASAAITFKYAIRFTIWPTWRIAFDELPVLKMIRFGLSSMLFMALSLALYRIDMVMVRHLANDTQAGLYAAAVQWSEFVWFVPMAVEGIMLQSTSPLWAGGRIDQITAMLSRLLRYVALGTAFLLLVIFVLADQILQIYFGSDFVEASLALRILVPGVFSFSLARVMWPVIQARGNSASLVFIITAATGVNLVLNGWLVAKWGAVGAAFATSISYGSVVFGYIWLLHRYGIRPFKALNGSRLLLLCLITIGVMAPAALIPWTLLAILVGGLLAGVVYIVGALWLNLLNVVELQQMIETLPTSLRRPGVQLFDLLQPIISRGFRNEA